MTGLVLGGLPLIRDYSSKSVYLVYMAKWTQPHIRDELKTAEHWHLYCVYSDDEFVSRVKHLEQPPLELSKRTRGEWRQPYKDIANEFCIDYLDVYRFKNHGMDALLLGASLVDNGIVMKRKNGEAIDIVLKRDITKDEFVELWEQIKRIQTHELKLKPKKRKPPESPELIYAIFKARKAKSYKQIFELYSNGVLEGYKGSTKQFIDQEAMERYYNRYRPDKR